MGNMLYNGVELPDINEVWTNKETYPYACILFYDNTIYCLFLSTDKLCRLGSSLVGCKDGAIKGIQYQMEDGSWSFLMNRDFGATSGAAYAPAIWSSYDFNYSDGSLILAASDPVDPNAPTEPTWTFNLQDFLSGMASAAASRGVLRRTPIAYLYSGVQLPGLPEVEGFEYKVIEHYKDSTYFVNLSKVKPTTRLIDDGVTPVIEAIGENGDVKSYVSEGNGWRELLTTNHLYVLSKDFIWANVDIVNGDISFISTDPIPVYE